MEDAVQWVFYIITVFVIFQEEERVRRISSELQCEILDLSEGENITEPCKRKNKIKKYSPGVSVGIPVTQPEDTAEFMNAASQGKLNVMDKYLADGGNPNIHDELGSRAIHWACRGGRLGVVTALKSHGADLNVRDKLNSTPLHVATRTGHTAIVEYLLSCGAKMNYRDREGDTALHDAVRLNRYKIVKLLIVAGADTGNKESCQGY
ncbi:Ankyrin repeat domain-containing protein 2 [Collichthys lucidus]|uniref:Ankyrin repeat domain-containing protein 2 n=1 Tax=Collichthys lucidus TaxID=240159 RepID=A0A4U5VCI8_COLLU|nr:Ankyrin repeat domain-containing protein 2 [Collichthys lucidus]